MSETISPTTAAEPEGTAALPNSPATMDDVLSPLDPAEILSKRKFSEDIEDAGHDEANSSAEMLLSEDDEDVKQDRDSTSDEPEPPAEEVECLDSSDNSSDSDDSSDGGDDVEVNYDATCNERMEKLPDFPAYDQEIPRIREQLTGIVRDVCKIVEQHPCGSSHMANFSEKGKGLFKIPEPAVIKIALVGNPGVGKSSLLNYLIDIPDLARALAAGESCTSVVTEYSGPLPGQEKKFAADVEYLDLDTVKKLLKEHFDAFVLHTYKFDKSTALATFRSLFCQRKEFASEEAARKFLYSNHTFGNKAVDILHTWCAACYTDVFSGNDDLTLSLVAETKAEYRALIDPLIDSTSKGG
ncbi:hypothetical protein CLAFUW4_03299 [Fulvia fulva]|nr:hypothetical protein CLAFUR4_03288 [Fulvia fulva]WPV10517.1 hypothetical protein CLAFUW4_03299 [Fulvia fulva]WPV25844.1 hypothetical protein CLAFUW7_03291 [Fulvia fulva]